MYEDLKSIVNDSHLSPTPFIFPFYFSETPADISMLRLLMDQYELNGTDFPEIGDKTLVSKILKGDRNLTKDHIIKLSERFDISPVLFFD